MKTKTFFLSLLLLVPLAGCNKEQSSGRLSPSEEQQMGTISIQLCGQDSGTKALSAYTQAQDYETQINSVQLLIFNDDGDLIKDARFTSSFSSMQATVPVGTYTVFAVVNKTCEDIGNIDELYEPQAYSIILNENSISGKNFVMSGSASCTVSANSTSSCPISVKRTVGRVALHSIIINTPSGYNVNLISAFLSNVCGESAVSGDPLRKSFYEEEWLTPKWYNYDGYNKLSIDMYDEFYIKDRGSVIVMADEAQLPSLTAYDISEDMFMAGDSWTRHDGVMSHVLFYGCPNANTEEPDGQHSYYSGQQTCLVICADVYSGWGNGGIYYYTIPLSSFEANKTYTIDLTITGFGSDDPNTPVKKGNMTASVTVSGWSAGDVIEKTI